MQYRTAGTCRARHAAVAAVLAAITAMLGGCLTPPDDASPIPKATFLARLIGICAGVNIWAEEEKKKSGDVQPAQIADQLERLIGAAVVGQPDRDRDKLDDLVVKLSKWDRALREQQRARAADDAQRASAENAVKEANSAADDAAVSYGMGHLDQCHKQLQQWHGQTSLPIPVQQAATAVVNGRIWVVGGLTGDGQPSDRTFTYDPVVDKWLDGPRLPKALNHAMAVAYRTHLVVIGGWVPIGSKVRGTTSREVLRLEGDSWEPLPPLSHARGAGGATVVGDRIVVAGGVDTEPVEQTEVFDGSSWHDGAPIPVPGDHLAAVSDGKFVYVVGGRKGLDPNQSTAALQRYDPQADLWSRMKDMSAPRGGLGAAYVHARIYAIGGETINSAQNLVEVYDIAGDFWTPAGSLPAGRHGLGVAALGDTLYAIGGATAAGHSNSTATVTELSLAGTTSPPGSASTTSAPPPVADLSVCPKALATHWACLSRAQLRDGALQIRYTTNFDPSPKQDPAYLHLHVFTARPDGAGGIVPPGETMQFDAGDTQGSWVSLYKRGVTVIPAGAATSGQRKPLDTSQPLLCIRVAKGSHFLAKDLSGGVHTGNCVGIQR